MGSQREVRRASPFKVGILGFMSKVYRIIPQLKEAEDAG